METARLMRGHSPWDETYIERYIPEAILNKLLSTKGWIDEDGFWWGFTYVHADTHRGRPYVCVASKPLGQGCHELKAIFPPSTEIETIFR